MYEIRKITPEQIIAVYHMDKEGRRRKEIAQATGFTVDKVKQIKNTLRLYLVDLKKPEKLEYVEAVKAILKEEGKEDLWATMTSTVWDKKRRFLPEQLVAVWNMREKEAKSFNKIGRELGIQVSAPYYIWSNLKRLLEWHPEAYTQANDEYREAVDIIKGNSVEPNSREQHILTATVIIKIWQMEKGRFSARKIAESLSWFEEGSTEYVRNISRNLDFYLAENTFKLLRSRKKAYMDARDYIMKNFQGDFEKKDIYLKHDGKHDLVIAMPTFYEEQSYTEDELLEMKLTKITKRIKQEVNLAIKEALIDEKPELKTLPPEMKDGKYHGYFLEDIEKYLGKEGFENKFIPWFSDRVGGIFEGKYYVNKDDFEEYMQQNMRQL